MSDLNWHYLLDILERLNVLRYYFILHHKGYVLTDIPKLVPNKSSKNNKIINIDKAKAIINILTNGEVVFFRFSYIKIYLIRLFIEEIDLRKKIDEIVSNLKTFIEQTNEISIGIEELAKNIVDHTKKKHGVIVARAHKKGKLLQLKDMDVNNWAGKTSKIKSFIEFNVIDSGLESISAKYFDTLKEMKDSEKNPTIKREIQEDIRNIGKDYSLLSLSNLFNYKSIKFLHQINRIRAKIGLILFSKIIIDDRKGFIKVTSANILTNKNSQCIITEDKKNDNPKMDVDILDKIGTNIMFIVPIYKGTKFISNTKKRYSKEELTKKLFHL